MLTDTSTGRVSGDGLSSLDGVARIILPISIFEIDAIPWQNPSRPIPNFLLANPIKKIRKIAPYHCKNQPLSFEAGYVDIHRFLGVSSLTKA